MLKTSQIVNSVTISKTLKATEGPEIWSRYFQKKNSDFQICVAPANKGDIRASYAVPQVALNSRGSLDIGWDMADRRKRGTPSDSVPSSRPRQRSRPSSDREGILQRMEAAAVIVLVLSTVVTSVVVHRLLPKPRQTIHEPRRLDWEEHTADINNRGDSFGGCIAWMNTRSRNWPRYFDLSSGGTSTTQVRSERETENRGVTEKHNIGTAVCVQLECPKLSCGTNVLMYYYVVHYCGIVR